MGKKQQLDGEWTHREDDELNHFDVNWVVSSPLVPCLLLLTCSSLHGMSYSYSQLYRVCSFSSSKERRPRRQKQNLRPFPFFPISSCSSFSPVHCLKLRHLIDLTSFFSKFFPHFFPVIFFNSPLSQGVFFFLSWQLYVLTLGNSVEREIGDTQLRFDVSELELEKNLTPKYDESHSTMEKKSMKRIEKSENIRRIIVPVFLILILLLQWEPSGRSDVNYVTQWNLHFTYTIQLSVSHY